MKKGHNYEYQRHRKRLIALIVSTYLSMLLLFLFIFGGFTLTFCLAAEEEISGNVGAFYDTEKENGYCFFFVDGFD